MSDVTAHPALPAINVIGWRDLREALALGWRDFRAAPRFGLFFSSVYVLGGFLMVWLGAGHVVWVVATSLGFPLLAPFAACGLYEVSRRLERGEPLDWAGVLGVVWRERTRQLPWAGAVIVLYFLFWTFFAHMLFAMIMGLGAMTSVSTSWDVFWTPRGLTMIALQLVTGGLTAFLLFSLTVVSLPLLLDREVDFVSAMLLSLRAVRTNPVVLGGWAVVSAAVTMVGLLPWFLGLGLTLPVLGHATWHLYRRVLA